MDIVTPVKSYIEHSGKEEVKAIKEQLITLLEIVSDREFILLMRKVDD